MTDQPPTSLRDWGISVLRTGVPLIWGNLLVFLGSRFPALDGLLHDPQVVGFSTILVAAVSLAWYALMRKVEPYIPPWLTVLVLGANATPVYLDLIASPVSPVVTDHGPTTPYPAPDDNL